MLLGEAVCTECVEVVIVNHDGALLLEVLVCTKNMTKTAFACQIGMLQKMNATECPNHPQRGQTPLQPFAGNCRGRQRRNGHIPHP